MGFKESSVAFFDKPAIESKDDAASETEDEGEEEDEDGVDEDDSESSEEEEENPVKKKGSVKKVSAPLTIKLIPKKTVRAN